MRALLVLLLLVIPAPPAGAPVESPPARYHYTH